MQMGTKIRTTQRFDSVVTRNATAVSEGTHHQGEIMWIGLSPGGVGDNRLVLFRVP